jgi:hypothetical protein
VTLLPFPLCLNLQAHFLVDREREGACDINQDRRKETGGGTKSNGDKKKINTIKNKTRRGK